MVSEHASCNDPYPSGTGFLDVQIFRDSSCVDEDKNTLAKTETEEFK